MLLLNVSFTTVVPNLWTTVSLFIQVYLPWCPKSFQCCAFFLQTLVDRCLHVIMGKSRPVLTSSQWLTSSRAAVSAVLDCPNLSVGELAVFQACMAWCTAQCEAAEQPLLPANLRQHLGDMLYKINMTNISLSEFSEHVVPGGLLTDSEELTVYKTLTNPSLKLKTPFATGRQNCLHLLKPHHILEMDSLGECNFDSVTFVFTLTVHSPLCLIEMHLYDLIGPHVINITIKSRPSAANSDVKVPPLGYSVKELTHHRQYAEKTTPVFVFKFGQSVNLVQTSYELSLTMLGEFDTNLYEPLQFGDKNMSVTRPEKDSPLFGLGYQLEDPNGQNPRPAVGQLSEATPPAPPRKISAPAAVRD